MIRVARHDPPEHFEREVREPACSKNQRGVRRNTAAASGVDCATCSVTGISEWQLLYRSTMSRKSRIISAMRPGESLKSAANRLVRNGKSGEVERDAEHWLIGKQMARGRTHGEAVVRVLNDTRDDDGEG